MKHRVVMSIALATLSFPLGGPLHAQQNPTGITVEGGVGFINPGSPVVPESEFTSRPIPRLPDGHVDLTGPWVGGGTVEDIGRDVAFRATFRCFPGRGS